MASPSASCSFGPGDLIDGKYRVRRVLGEGGMGTVLAAKMIGTGTDVAVKVLHAKFRQSGVIRERFLREGRAAAALTSPHVVRVFEVGADPHGVPYLVMERLVGCDLQELVTKRGVLSEEAALDYVLQACDALTEAHQLGIVHRDLKPENLFLTRGPDGKDMVRVLDFGISKSALEAKQLTAMGEVMGTPHFMAPEQFTCARSTTARSDVWSLGAILYRLVTGALPFEANNFVDLAYRVKNEPPIAMRLRRPTASREVTLIVRRCLEKDPSARFADAGELRSAIEDARAFAATQRAGKVLQLPPAAKPETPKRRRRGYLLLVAAVFTSIMATFASTERARASAGYFELVSKRVETAGEIAKK